MDKKYKVIYLLENEKVIVSEIKRTDITSDDKSKIYFWIVYDKRDQTLCPLQFESMNTDGAVEKRTFASGRIEFDTHRGTYYTSESTESLTVRDVNNLSILQALHQAIVNFLE